MSKSLYIYKKLINVYRYLELIFLQNLKLFLKYLKTSNNYYKAYLYISRKILKYFAKKQLVDANKTYKRFSILVDIDITF